ncbi:MAG TPA: hypothetical protein VF885_09190 [Arthrobacter sp.]
MIRRVSAALTGQRGDYLAQALVGSLVSMLVLGVVAVGIMGASTFQAQMAVRSSVTNEASTTDSALRTDLTWASSMEVTDSRKFKLTVPGTDKKCRISEWSIDDSGENTRILNTVYNYPSYNANTNPVSCSGTASQPNEQTMISNASPGSAFGYRNAGGRELTFAGGKVSQADPGAVPAGSGTTKGNWDSNEADTVSLETAIGYTTKVATPYKFVQAATSLNRSSRSATAERHFIQQGSLAALTVGPLAINYSAATVFTAGTASQQLRPTVTGPTATKTYSVAGVLPANTSFDPTTGYITGPATWNAQVSQIESGNDSACVLITGTVYCWGSNHSNKLGDGLTADTSRAAFDSSRPVAGALAGKTVSGLSVGADHACAIANSRAYCWGGGWGGKIGNGSFTEQAVPVLVSGGDMAGKNVTAISAGYNTTCAVADGEAFCWGYGGQGNVGTGNAVSQNPLPVAVDKTAFGGRTVTHIAAGSRESVCAIADGLPFCWGNNTWGQLGDGTGVAATSPVAVTADAFGGKPVTSISVGQGHACAIAGGTVYCWGSYANGRLGLGAVATLQLTPQPVVTNLAGVVATKVSLGYYHSCILTTTGDTYCWGNGASGRLGTGASGTVTVPTKSTAVNAVVGTKVQTLSASESHTCIISSGGPYCYGDGAGFRLGTGTDTDAVTPAPALGLPGNAGFPSTVTVTATTGASTAATTITLRLK